MTRKRNIVSIGIVAVILFIISVIPLPYYVSRPGITLELGDVIEVEGSQEGEGEFMLTTIRM